MANCPAGTMPAADSLTPEAAQELIRARIAGLAYLPTAAAVAVKFVELGKNPDAEPADYARVIGADSSLSTKLLALANSSWAGVRTRVTTIKTAVNLLGLGTVRTLAISYCMTGLHNELRLSPAEAELLWEAGLYKAVAARQLAAAIEPAASDEAYIAGLFQDFATAVIYSVVREPYLELLRDPLVDVAARLEQERERYGIDHAAAGRELATRLELPDLFTQAIAHHHDYAALGTHVERAAVRDGVAAAALLPHVLNAWNRADLETLTTFLAERTPQVPLATFVANLQVEFDQLYSFFNEGRTSHNQLESLLINTARESAEQTTGLVQRVNEMLHEAAAQGVAVDEQFRTLESRARNDALTGALTRLGFTNAARDALAGASRCGSSITVVYLDLDGFKQANDTHGHAFGDKLLVAATGAIKAALPPAGLVGRLGGDEFVALVTGLGASEASAAAQSMLTNIASTGAGQVTASAGLLYVKPSRKLQALETLLAIADKLMYTAKHGGGNRYAQRAV